MFGLMSELIEDSTNMVRIIVLLLCLAAVASSTPAKNLFGKHYQGDIKLTPLQRQVFFGEGVNPNTGIFDPINHWPTNLEGHVVVPYRIQASEGFSKLVRSI